MSDNEIIEAFEQVVRQKPYHLNQDVLNLLNRLKSESNKYRNKYQAQKGELTRLYKEIKRQKAEIEDLKASSKVRDDFIDEQNKEIESLESRIFALNDTNKMLMDSQEIYWKNKVKEFICRLKTHAYYISFPKEHRVVDENDIDNLAKETTEQKE